MHAPQGRRPVATMLVALLAATAAAASGPLGARTPATPDLDPGPDAWPTAAKESWARSLSVEAAHRLGVMHDHDADAWSRALAAVEVASWWQTGSRESDRPVAAAAHHDVRGALRALLSSYELPWTAAADAVVERSDGLDPPVRASLTATIDAFVALDRARQVAFDEVPPQRLRARAASPAAEQAAGPPEEFLARLGIDLAPVLAARQDLVRAAAGLAATWSRSPSASGATGALVLAPALGLDLDGGDTDYEDDLALVIDVGGHDVYTNNAGGSNLNGGVCSAVKVGVATAVIDLGGNDVYGDPSAAPTSRRSCGVNGAGYSGGVGVLVDGAGDDLYVGGGSGANGGGYLAGVGLLLDVAGSDVYTPGDFASNGGGYFGGAGALIDLAGDDLYGEPGADVDPAATLPGPSDVGRSDPTGEIDAALYRVPAGVWTDVIIGTDASSGQPDVGAAFHGATVTSADPTLRFVTVATDRVPELVHRLSADPLVRYAEVDAPIVVDTYVPNDPFLFYQYGPMRVNALEAWDLGLGAPTKDVCVVDSGVRWTHEDLSARYLGGVDLVGNDDDPMDGLGHGTHVSGIATATIDNGKGIAGIANVGLKAVRVLDNNGGGTASRMASGIARCADIGGDVISVSLSIPPSQALRDAAQYAWAAGSLLVKSAGNLGCYDCITSPGDLPEFLAVTCTDDRDAMCGFSSWGQKAELSAPGDSILSTYIGSDGSYASLSGTSMSAPHVSGVAALAWSMAPELTNAQLRQLLRDTARAGPAGGCEIRFGFGIVDARALVEAVLDASRRPQLQPFDHCATGNFGANGGGNAGIGLLYDASGNDRYHGGSEGANGGAVSFGSGLLVDAAGDDVYAGHSGGVNGGGNGGSGALIDLVGADTYLATAMGANGGAIGTGRGILVDGDGDDRYVARSVAVNGGADGLAVGLLLDGGGADRYEEDGTETWDTSRTQGTAGARFDL